MNSSYQSRQDDALQARYGLRVAARLSAGLDEGLPHDIAERLRVARQQAVARRKRPQAPSAAATTTTTTAPRPRFGFVLGDDRLGLWGWLASGALALALAAGLVAINITQDNDRTLELANLDAALLTDDLPPEAYADPGFLQYLKQPARPAKKSRPAARKAP